MNENKIKVSIKKLDDFIHELDPLGLGGAPGEYSDSVFYLYKIAQEKRGIVDNRDIKSSFEKLFGELTNNMNDQDFSMIKDFVSKLF